MGRASRTAGRALPLGSRCYEVASHDERSLAKEVPTRPSEPSGLAGSRLACMRQESVASVSKEKLSSAVTP